MNDLRVSIVQGATRWHDPAGNRTYYGDLIAGEIFNMMASYLVITLGLGVIRYMKVPLHGSVFGVAIHFFDQGYLSNDDHLVFGADLPLKDHLIDGFGLCFADVRHHGFPVLGHLPHAFEGFQTL